MRYKNKKGFTLIELIVVMAILAMLASIAIPMYQDVAERSRMEADNASLVVLNQSSVAYAIVEDIPTPDVDIFDGISTNQGRIQKLIDERFLVSAPRAQQNDAQFKWEVTKQKWVISGGAELEEDKNYGEPAEGDIGEPTPDATPEPTADPSSEPTEEGPDLSGYPMWDSEATYENNNTFVIYDGKLYYNLWWVNGTTLPGTNQVWQQVSDEWVYYNIYDTGDTTAYNGITYRARYWTSQQTPTHSQWGAWEQISPPPDF